MVFMEYFLMEGNFLITIYGCFILFIASTNIHNLTQNINVVLASKANQFFE